MKIELENALFEMANIPPERTGLISTIYCTYNGANQNYEHNIPRIKVATNNHNLVPISISADSKVLLKNINFRKEDKERLNKAIKYMNKHHEIFMKHWLGEIDDTILGITLTLIYKNHLSDADALRKALEF